MESNQNTEVQQHYTLSYQEKIELIILKIRAVYFIPELQPEALEEVVAFAATAFAEILKPVIPIEYLEQSYILAVQNNKTGFPISASSMVTAYYQIMETKNALPPSIPCKFCEFGKENPDRPCQFHTVKK